MLKPNDTTLVIVESPKKAKLLTNMLGDKFLVIASYGHVRSLPSKPGSINVHNDFEPKWETKQITKTLVQSAKKCGKIIVATDADREGEAIAFHISNILRENKINTEIIRARFNSLEKSAVLKALEDRSEIDQDLVNSYLARLTLDYLVGFSISPLLWRKIPGNKSAGRVQSVGLRVIIDREKEIVLFEPKDYWEIDIRDSYNTEFVLKEWKNQEVKQFFYENHEHASSIAAEIPQHEWRVTSVTERKRQQKPSPPFITSTMQQAASNSLGIRPSYTMKLAQELYEGVQIGTELVGLITYMRTDSTNVHPDAIDACRKQITKQFGTEYLSQEPMHYAKKTGQHAHEAIRPANYSITPEMARKSLGGQLASLYELIWKRAIASQMAESVSLNTQVEAESKSGVIVAKGTRPLFLGYKLIYNDDSALQEPLRSIHEGEKISIGSSRVSSHQTQPPRRYTEAGLIKELEKQGIGRPSTYDKIISVLQYREYVRRDGQTLIPEDRGWIVCGFLEELFEKYMANTFTRDVEQELDAISEGTTSVKQTLEKFWTDFTDYLSRAEKLEPGSVQTALQKQLASYLITEKVCPKCNGAPMIKYSKTGGFVGCANYPECKWMRPLLSKQIAIFEDEEDRLVLKRGPYGRYMHWEIKNKKIPVPANIKDEKLVWENVKHWADLPKELGVIGDTKISLGIGRLGVYIRKSVPGIPKDEYRSVPTSYNISDITLKEAIEILERPRRVMKKLISIPKQKNKSPTSKSKKSVQTKKGETKKKLAKAKDA